MARDVVTLSLAAIGAVLGVLNTWKVFARERVKLRVVPKHAIPIGAVDPRLTFCIEVINVGGVALTVNEVGVFHQGTSKRSAVITPVIADKGPWPRRLEPRSAVTVYAQGASLPMQGHPIRCAYAMTDCGRTFEGNSAALSDFS
jgi:hypothetical protein